MKTIIHLFFMLSAATLAAQSTASLTSLINAISNEVGTVENGKNETFRQQFTYDEQLPWKVKLEVVRVDRKGREASRAYHFNLGDLDKNTIRVSSNRNEQIVKASIVGRDDFIQEIEEGELDGYTSSIEIRATDIDAARRIEEVLEGAIRPARDAWSTHNKVEGNAADWIKWLTTYVEKARIDEDEEIAQQILFDEEKKDRIRIDRTEEEEKSAYSFSLADIDPKRLKLEVKDDEMYLYGRTMNSKEFIEYYEEGTLDDHENSFRIYFNDIDRGRQAMMVMDSLIDYGKRELEKRLPQPSGLENAFQLLSDQITDFTTEEDKYEQQLDAGLNAIYKVKVTELDDGDVELEEYIFSFADLDEKDVDIEVNKSVTKVELDTRNNNQYIEYREDGELDDFTASMDIYASSIEHARMIKHLSAYVIAEAAKVPVEEKDWSWLQQAVKKGSTDEVSQSLAIQEGENTNCKLVFNRTTTDDDEVEEEVFEFNVYDLNINRVKVDVARNEAGLFFRTVDGEDIIKHYENGKPGFTDDIKIRLEDIATSKIAVSTMKTIINTCKVAQRD